MNGLFLEQQSRKYEGAALLFFGCVAIVLRVLALITSGAIEMDGMDYARAAEFFARAEFAQALKGLRAPFYPMVTGIFHLVIPDVELAGRLVSLVFGILLIPFCFLMVRKFFSERTATYAAFFVAIHPYMIRFSAPVLTESMATFLFTAAVFFYYSGWISNHPRDTALAGFFLTLAYMTRSEYIIYFIPLTIILLLRQRRVLNLSAFLACFFLIAIAFLLYIRTETGFWVIDKKMLAWKAQTGASSSFAFFLGNVGLVGALKNLPIVAYHFCEAVFPPFLILGIFGFNRVERRYRLIVLILVATHIVARSFVEHATRRYSIEFAPVVIVFVAEGMETLFVYFKRYTRQTVLFCATVVVVAGLSLFQGFSFGSHGRELQKEAGLYLRRHAADGGVASRLPIVAFYSRTDWVELPKVWAATQNCEKLRSNLETAHVRYLVLDDRMEKEAAPVVACLTDFRIVGEFRSGKDYVRIYQQSR